MKVEIRKLKIKKKQILKSEHAMQLNVGLRILQLEKIMVKKTEY